MGVLKVQLSHLFKECLKLQRQFTTGLPDFFNKLSPDAVNILLKKDDLYEALFFAQALEDELLKFEELKYDLDYQIRFSSKEKISDRFELQKWLSRNITSLENYIISSDQLMNNAFQKFYGAPGAKSDLKGLYYVACGLTRLFQEFLNWYNAIMCTSVEEEFILLRNSFARYTIDSALKIWEFPKLIKTEINNARDLIQSGHTAPINIIITLKLDVESEAKKEFHIEMDKLLRKYK